jgi:nucleoside-diphosphate-sugar epimerase
MLLVTGCAGFIGSNLCKALLARGHRVRGIDNLLAGTRANVPAGVDFHERDVRDPAIADLFAGVDVVFHLAARNCLSDCMAHPADTADINVKGTVQVLEACRRQQVPKIVYADTSAEYEGIDQFPSREDRVAPVGTYAVSKRAGALFVESHHALYGQRFTILRYFNVYGPAQDWRRVVPPVMAAFVLKMLAGERPVIYGTGEKRRDFVYVDDVNDFHLRCIDDERTDGRTFNVGSGRSWSIREIFAAIEAQLRTGLAPEHRPDLPGEAFQTLADVGAARALGWAPKVGLEEGLRRTIEYLRGVRQEELVR